MTLDEIQGLAKGYADARGLLSERVQALQDELEAAKRRKLPGIKSAVAAAKEAEADLRAAIEAAPGLFVKPRRTVIAHGVKLGYAKSRGELMWDDEQSVIMRIEKFFPEQVDSLIITKKKPSKSALNQMDASELRKLGVTVSETGDCVLIKPADSDVDRLVSALLKETHDEVEEG